LDITRITPHPDVLMDAQYLGFRDNSIDEVVARRFVQGIRDNDKVLAEIHRVMKPKGLFKLISSTWTGWLYYWLIYRAIEFAKRRTHCYNVYRLHSDSLVRRILREAKFDVKRLYHLGSRWKFGYDIVATCEKYGGKQR
jgi:ubiquinone/menaquinone biosynthesis C-methylase UbiE